MWMPIVLLLIYRNNYMLTIWAPYLERLIQKPHITAVLTPLASSKEQLPICITFSECFASIKHMPVPQCFLHSDVLHRWNSPASRCTKCARNERLSIAADEYLSVTMWRKKDIKSYYSSFSHHRETYTTKFEGQVQQWYMISQVSTSPQCWRCWWCRGSHCREGS